MVAVVSMKATMYKKYRGAAGLADVAESEAALPEEHPMAGAEQVATDGLVIAEDRRAGEADVAVATEHERVAHQEVRDEPEAEDGEVRRHDVGTVLGATEARLDERETGLHEDDQDRTNDDPEQVHSLRKTATAWIRNRGHVLCERGCREREGQRAGQPQAREDLAPHVHAFLSNGMSALTSLSEVGRRPARRKVKARDHAPVSTR